MYKKITATVIAMLIAFAGFTPGAAALCLTLG